LILFYDSSVGELIGICYTLGTTPNHEKKFIHRRKSFKLPVSAIKVTAPIYPITKLTLKIISHFNASYKHTENYSP
jgi:hypothetical protein